MPSESHQDPRSRNTQYSTEDVSATPEAIPQYVQPAPDRYGGVNFPYRGQQTHGVEPTDTAVGSPDDYEGGSVEVAYEAPEDDVPPVPVRIVETAAHEYTQFRAIQAFANPAPTLVLSRKEGRERVTVKNIDSSTGTHVWVGPDSNVSKMSGFRVEKDGGSVTLERCESEIWAIADDPLKVVPLCIIFEFSTAQR
jgi:hypothetical protein